MSNDMCSPSDLVHLPGAPFTESEVDAAVGAVRNAAGWHIAPVRGGGDSDAEPFTAVLDVGSGESVLRLPTRRLIGVDEIRDTDTDDVIDASLYRVSTGQGLVEHKTGFWPAGFGRVAVDFVHGHDTVPPELLPVIAAEIAKYRRTHSVQSQQQANTNPDLIYEADEWALERHSLWYCPGMA